MCVEQEDSVFWHGLFFNRPLSPSILSLKEAFCNNATATHYSPTFREVVLTEKVDSRVMASVLFMDFTAVKQSVTLKRESDCG